MQFPSFVLRDSLHRPRHPRWTGRYVAGRVLRAAESAIVLGVAPVQTIEGEVLRLVVLGGPGDIADGGVVEAA